MNTKAKGSRAERKAKTILTRRGYQLVVKSGASLGLFDLIALGLDYDHVLLVQVKSNRRPSLQEMQRLTAFQCPTFCRKEVWIFLDYEKEPMVIDL